MLVTRPIEGGEILFTGSQKLRKQTGKNGSLWVAIWGKGGGGGKERRPSCKEAEKQPVVKEPKRRYVERIVSTFQLKTNPTLKDEDPQGEKKKKKRGSRRELDCGHGGELVVIDANLLYGTERTGAAMKGLSRQGKKSNLNEDRKISGGHTYKW